MRHYECECTQCGNKTQIAFEKEPYPLLGEYVQHLCKKCEYITRHTRTITRKAILEEKQKEKELNIQEAIKAQCSMYGFFCKFLLQSVIITTPLSDWSFDYHQPNKTLYHESTIKINFATGNYSKCHTQFKDRNMSIAEVIDYIAEHERWKSGRITQT